MEAKPWGNGFDAMERPASFADFMAWWSGESWFPVEPKTKDEIEPEAQIPLAA